MSGKPLPELVITAATAVSLLRGKETDSKISDLWGDPFAAADYQIWVLPTSLGSFSAVCE